MKKKLIAFLTVISLGIPCFSQAGEEGNLDNPNSNKDSSEITGDIFGRKGGYIHPFLSITELYSDNIFNESTNTDSDSATVFSPGIWLAVPSTRKQVLAINASSATPGGLDYDIQHSRSSRRFQSYMLLASDFAIYADHSSADTEEYRVEGFLQYNFAGGVSLELIDQFIASHDDWNTEIATTELDKFKNNLFTMRVIYDLNDKFSIRADYSNYAVNYNAARNNSKDRSDNSFAAYCFFRFRPKYSLFAEYDFVDVEYDTNTGEDNKAHQFYGGLDWDITAKSSGRLQAGYTIKKFDAALLDDDNYFSLKAQATHRFTSKTSLELSALRQVRESDIDAFNDMVTNEITATYIQRITGKITANIALSYTEDAYNGLQAGQTEEREDTFYNASPSLNYQFKKWVSAQVAYEYSERDSNFSTFDYKDNTFFIRIKTSL